ncbi:MAG: hypothetical protein R3E68_22225 [Burkholderiaceae bacterium]
MMYRLSPPVLHDLGLVSALEWLAEEMQRDYGLEVTVDSSHSGSFSTLDPTVRALLFRCVKELLVNVAKHAKVSRADLSVSVKRRQVLVKVSDAGVGFSEPVLAQPGVGGRYGLVSVRERIGFIDGDFKIDSIPGNGTVAVLSVPLGKQTRARRAPGDDR